MTVLLLHGTGGSPKENWFPWIKKELYQSGHRVFIPHFTNPQKGHTVKSWLEVLEKYKKYINEDTILIGHSLGGLFLLRVLERLDNPVKAAMFVGAPIGVKPIKFYDSDYKFSGFSFDWVKIKRNAKLFVVFHSDDDPYVSLGNGDKLADNLGINLSFIPNAGHFNTDAGYTTFPHLLKIIEGIR